MSDFDAAFLKEIKLRSPPVSKVAASVAERLLAMGYIQAWDWKANRAADRHTIKPVFHITEEGERALADKLR